MNLLINGKDQSFPSLQNSSPLIALIDYLKLTGDRIAIEHNGDIVPRAEWASCVLADGDRLEIVHFVGGGAF